MNKKIFYLGVEGGASKSIAALAGEKGKIVKKRQGRALNYHALGEARTKVHMDELLTPLFLFARRRGTIARAVFGLAGLDSPKDEEHYRKIIRSIVPHGMEFQLYNDAKVALEALCPDASQRILIISGTGSNVYGEKGKKSARAGGQGFLMSDEGSAYESGNLVLRAAVRSWDGRIAKTYLEQAALAHAGVVTVTELIAYVHRLWNKEPHRYKMGIASFSKALDAALVKKDKEAQAIRAHCAHELALGVRTVVQRLNMDTKKEVCVGMVGAQFHMPGLRTLVEKEVRAFLLRAVFVEKHGEGVKGAIKLSIDSQKVEFRK